MLRIIYACLLALHPPAFRRRFMPEMLSIFDEAGISLGGLSLLGDAMVSLARQWILRSGSWKVAVALAAALLQITAGGLIWNALGHGQASSRSAGELDRLIEFILTSTGALVLMVTAVSLWARGFLQRRISVARPLR